MLGGKTALVDGGLGVAFVAHLALDHADEVGTEDTADCGDYTGDYRALEGGESALEDLVYYVHYVVDGGCNVWCVGDDVFGHVEGEILGLFV